VETSANYWSSPELLGISYAGARDLWRDTVDLKQEYYLKINDGDVFLGASATQLSGVPADVHKVYLIEPRDTSDSSSNSGVIFKPLDYNHVYFRSARARAATDPSNEVLYYAITGQGAPVSAPVIHVAPKITSAMNVTFSYVPTLGDLTASSVVPIPGEADNALVAWTVAFALAKEREDKSPDPNWLSIFATEKQHLLQSLGLRQLQEPEFVEAVFSEYW
jgi:hypothetical protein